MRTLILTIAAASVLAACGSDAPDAEAVEEGNFTVDPETGDTTSSIITEDGSASFKSGASVDADLPAGFSIYPGAEIVSVTNISRGENKGAMVTMLSDASAAELAAFYREQAQAAGVAIELDMTVDDGIMLGGTGADGLNFSLNTVPEEVVPDEESSDGESGKDNDAEPIRPKREDGRITAQLVVSKGLVN